MSGKRWAEAKASQMDTPGGACWVVVLHPDDDDSVIWLPLQAEEEHAEGVAAYFRGDLDGRVALAAERDAALAEVKALRQALAHHLRLLSDVVRVVSMGLEEPENHAGRTARMERLRRIASNALAATEGGETSG